MMNTFIPGFVLFSVTLVSSASLEWECSDKVWYAYRDVEYCKTIKNDCSAANETCATHNARVAEDCPAFKEKWPYKDDFGGGSWKANMCCTKGDSERRQFICTRKMTWKSTLNYDYMAFFLHFDNTKNVAELEKSTCATINATLDFTYSKNKALWPFLDQEFKGNDDKLYLVSGNVESGYWCKKNWINEISEECQYKSLVGHMCRKFNAKWKPFLDHDYLAFLHPFNQSKNVNELEKDTCATINATLELTKTNHSVLQKFLVEEFTVTDVKRYLISGDVNTYHCTESNGTSENEWNKQECNNGNLVGLICKRFRLQNTRLLQFGNGEKANQNEVNDMCSFMNSSLPCLDRCSEVKQFTLFTNQFDDADDYWIRYSEACKVFEVPLRGLESKQFPIFRKSNQRWYGSEKDGKTKGFICERNVSSGKQAAQCNPAVTYTTPTYCLDAGNLSQKSEAALNTADGNTFSGVVGVENWMTKVALSFLSKEVQGSIPTTSLNINESYLQNEIVRGINNSGAKLQRLVVNKSEGGRLAMVLGRSKEMPPNVKSFISSASTTVEKQTTLANRHFSQKVNTLTPEKGFVIIGAFGGHEGAKLAAEPEFSVTNEVDFEREIVSKWKSEFDDLKQVIFTEVKPTCTYVDPNASIIEDTQLTAGCITHPNGTATTCSCNHTTIFSVLLSVKAVSVPKEVKYVTYATEGASIFFLLVTAATLIRVRKSVGSDRTFVQINLCLALVLLHGTSLFHDFSRQNARICEIYAVALHYFLLVSGFSMLLEGITLAMKTSRKSLQYAAEDKSVINRFRLVVAWVVPALITATGAVTGFFTDTYMTPGPIYLSGLVAPSNTSPYKYNRCWLDPQHLVFWCTVVAPLALVLTINLAVMVRVMVLMVQLQRRDKQHRVDPIAQPGAEPKPQKPDTSQLRSTLRMLAMLCPVMGFPWVLGFCIGLDVSSDLILIFGNALVNGLQGFLVFLVYCVFGKEVRKAVVSGLRNSAISQHFGWSWQSNNHDN